MSVTPLRTRVEIAPGADPSASPVTWAWEYAGKRRQSAAIEITGGRDDEAATVEAGSFAATMENRDGNLSPRNILGQWYGQLHRGTPLRLTYDRTTDTFGRTVSAGGWGTNDDGFTWIPRSDRTTYYSVDGTRGVLTLPTNFDSYVLLDQAGSLDVEVVWSTTLPVLPTGANFVSGSMLRREDDSTFLKVQIELTPAGAVNVLARRHLSTGDTTLIGSTASGVTYSAGQKVWAKARADGPYIMIKTWTGNRSDEPSTWTASSTDNVIEGGGAGLYHWRINSNAGTYTAYIDDIEIVNLLWSGTVPEWPVRWPNKSGKDSTLPINAAGILRKIGQGARNLKSPLRNLLGNLSYTAQYIPGEDAAGATVAASAVSGAPPATVVDVGFAADDTLPGSGATMVLNTYGVSKISGKIPPKNTTDGYAAMMLAKLETLPVTNVPVYEFRATGTHTRVVVLMSPTGFILRSYDRDGNLVVNTTALYVVDPTQWVAFQMETNVSGGTVNVALSWHQVGETVFYGINDNYSGTATRLDYFTVIGASANMAVAHLWMGDNDLPFVATTFSKVSNGYIGEPAADRIARLCRENSVPVLALSGDSEPMGRQKVAKLLDLLRECEAADMGILYERGAALAYVPRVRRYNMPVAMSLSWPGLFDEPPEPADNDQRLRNSWTVKRTDGSSVTVTDQDSVDQSGLWEDETEINIESDDRLFDFAAWLTSLGTSDELRWPRITINLLKHPELIGPWLSCRIGSRIQISDPPSQIAGEVIDLLIEGFSQTINNYEWIVELSCAPARPWEIGVYDDTTYRYDVDSYIEADLAADDTTVAVICRDRNGFWSHLDTPYDVIVSGQRNTVVGMSQPDSVAVRDGTFEDGDPVANLWAAAGAGNTGTLAGSQAQAHTGTWSALMTVGGTPVQAIIRNTATIPASPGQAFTTEMWVYCSAARTIGAVIDWYNGASFLSSASASTAVAANTWTKLTVSGTAPASTTRVEYGPTMASSPPAGTLLYLDDIQLIRTDVRNARQLAKLVRGVDGFTKALPSGADFRIANPGRYGI